MSEEPTMTVKSLLEREWDPSTNALAADDQPVFHTGAYDREGALPVVTFPSMDEGPIGGGETGMTAIDGPTGQGMQRLQGYVLIDCVAGMRDTLRDRAADGGDINPKSLRWSMYDHAAQVLLDYSPSEFITLAPTSGTTLVDVDEGPAVYRHQFRARYVRDRDPSPSA